MIASGFSQLKLTFEIFYSSQYGAMLPFFFFLFFLNADSCRTPLWAAYGVYLEVHVNDTFLAEQGHCSQERDKIKAII